MSLTISPSADGLSAALQIGGVTKATIGASGIAAGSYAPASVTPTDLSQKLTLGTAQATTSGTSIDFTGIPSWVKRITIMLNGVSTNGTSQVQIRLGTSSGIENSGYSGSSDTSSTTVAAVTSSTGFVLERSGAGAAANIRSGSVTFVCFGSNTWVGTSTVGYTSGQLSYAAYSKTLSGTIDRIRLTTVNETDTFDAGSINVMYE